MMNIKHSLSKCSFLALPMQFFKKNISQMSKGQWGQLQSGQESTECTIAFVASLFSGEWRCPELALQPVEYKLLFVALDLSALLQCS